MKYRHSDSLIKALFWLQKSPSLLSGNASKYVLEKALPEGIDLFLADQKSLSPLIHRLEQQNWLPLGIYYEQLWHFLFELWQPQNNIELISHNLQVQKTDCQPPETLGEYDLVYRLNDHFIHRELAVKFYLGIPQAEGNESQWQNWVGPGLKDRLDHKMQRMTRHQVTLSDTPEGKQALKALGISQVKKEILIQGRLFYPMFACCPPPVTANPNHLRGFWLTQSQLEHWLLQQPPETSGQFIQKPFWLDNEVQNHQQSPTRLLSTISSQRLPAMMKFQNQYFFVVPDCWPEQALQFNKG